MGGSAAALLALPHRAARHGWAPAEKRALLETGSAYPCVKTPAAFGSNA